MILIFACATSDVLRTDLPLDDPGQPWICEIAAELVDADGNPLASFWSPINSEGRKIKDGAAEVHGITSRDAAKHGVSEIAALGVLIGMANQAKVAVSFNDHARKVVASILIRNRKSVEKWMRPGLCFPELREAVRAACKIPSETEDGQYRQPKIDEACSILLSEPSREGPKSAHDDVQRVRRLFFELKRQNLIEVVL